MTCKAIAAAVLVPTLCLVLPGCGSGEEIPELGKVSGTVTLDGKPLANATVAFEPQKKGALSTGTTDESGKYVLMYNSELPGAAVGEHVVRISSTGAGDGGSDGEPTPDEILSLSVAEEQIPAKYNTASNLVREVKPGENELDFELTTKGGSKAEESGPPLF